MTLHRAVLAFAGASPYWLLLTVFAGLNLIQASFTGFCQAALAFKGLGVMSGVAFR